jgi:hypothetical protein
MEQNIGETAMNVKSINEILGSIESAYNDGGMEAINKLPSEDLYALYRSYLMIQSILKMRDAQSIKDLKSSIDTTS